MGEMSHKVIKALEVKGISKTAFAEQVGISRDTVYNLDRESIKFSTLLKICKALDMDIHEFIEPVAEVAEPKTSYTKGKKTVLRLRPNDRVCLLPGGKILEIIHEH